MKGRRPDPNSCPRHGNTRQRHRFLILDARSRLPKILAGGIAVALGLICLFVTTPGSAAGSLSPHEVRRDYMVERAPTYHAFIFANDAYSQLDHIDSAAQDFHDMKKFFKRLHYRIWDMGNHGRFRTVDEFYKYVSMAREQVHPGDVVVIYYSGHGFYYGNQNWLVPLDYPTGTVDPQTLYKRAVGLNDVIAGLAEKRIDYAIAILDSCRTNVSFPFVDGAGIRDIKDSGLPPFSLRGPSLVAWSIGVPAYSGDQAMGTPSSNETSLYTEVLVDALKSKSRISDLQTALTIAVNHLTQAGKIPAGMLAPHFLNSSDFDFNPLPDAGLAGRQKRDWISAITEPSRLDVSDYLIANPGSRFSTAAWEYIDGHPTDPDDLSGASLTSPEAVDASFPEGLQSGKLIAIATSGFDVNFPRNMIGAIPSNPSVIEDSIVYADRNDEIPAEYASRYEDKGSKLQYDIGLVGSANSLAINTGQILRDAPSGDAKLAMTFGKSASVKIGGTIFDKASGKLFAQVRPAGIQILNGLNSWAGLGYNEDTQPSFNVINRALREAVVGDDLLNGLDRSSSIKSVTDEVQRSSKEILWVSIAVDYSPPDLTSLQDQLVQADTDAMRASVLVQIENLNNSDRRNLAGARLRAQSARLQLIKSGVDGKRISMVSETQNAIGSGVRLRFFGSR